MRLAPESVIICEGYHDRAFLRSWLKWLGCESLENKPYRDGKPVKGKGQYAFRTPSGGWVRILPVEGDANVIPSAEVEITAGKTSPIARLVLVYDQDAPETAAQCEARRNTFAGWATHQQASPVPDTDDFELAGGVVATRLSLIVWRSLAAPSQLLPAQQTIERLVCAAIAETYPARCRAVLDWITARPAPPANEKFHKTHVASHMAGWFSDRGYEGIFDAVWEGERNPIRDALLAALNAIDAKRVIDALLADHAEPRVS